MSAGGVSVVEIDYSLFLLVNAVVTIVNIKFGSAA